MIVTVTMNPAVDKTVEIDRLLPGGLNRVKKAVYDAGGKGINVSKTIRELGGKSVATGFLGGGAGEAIEAALREKGIPRDFIRIRGETRTNTKIYEKSGAVTEINEPGPGVGWEQIEELLEKLAGYAGKDTLFVLSGSVPAGVDEGIYARIIRLVHEKGAAVLVDAEGPLLQRALLEKPDMIKPNRAELEDCAGLAHGAPVEALLQKIKALEKTGIRKAAVSLGKDGAFFVFGEYQAFCPGLLVKAHSTVGAGDAMTAALAYAFAKKLDERETVRLCMAASAGAVTTVGTRPPSGELVEELKKRVVIQNFF